MSTTVRRWVGRGRLRDAARDYARRYLNVSRLPAGVPAIIDAWCDAQEKPDYSYPFGAPEFFGPNRSLAAQLQRFRKPSRYA